MKKKILYRRLPNPRSNDFNKEPETIRVKYFIVGESADKKQWLVERAGWHGKKHQHYIDKNDFIYTNFDLITESVESFVEWINETYESIPECVPCLPTLGCVKKYKCTECFKKWLQQESE